MYIHIHIYIHRYRFIYTHVVTAIYFETIYNSFTKLSLLSFFKLDI